jgi:hypothetical protein
MIKKSGIKLWKMRDYEVILRQLMYMKLSKSIYEIKVSKLTKLGSDNPRKTNKHRQIVILHNANNLYKLAYCENSRNIIDGLQYFWINICVTKVSMRAHICDN